MSFNLFAAEEQVIDQADRLKERLATLAPECCDDLGALIDAFKRSTRDQRRLVRVSDRLQAQLAAANEELERRRLEAETALNHLRDAQDIIVRSERLASLGALVAGVAHEINTPVGIAVSCASHLSDATAGLKARVERGELGRADFNRYLATAADTTALILANCGRAATLINSFKQVAVDRASSERRTLKLGVYVQEVLLSLQPELRQNQHTVMVDCPPDLSVDSFPGALSQILTNLVINALQHAYADGRSGTMSIRIRRIAEPSPEAGAGTGGGAGSGAETVEMVFADDGSGIPPDALPHVFEPFFTTRRGEGGSGLGLHIVHNLVSGPLGGTIAVESGTGRGTAFTLRFPARAPLPPEDRVAED